jgi:periplasmic protein TonB
MEVFEYIFSDFKRSLAASAGLHLLIFLLFLGIDIGIDFSAAEFSEIGFVSSAQSSRTRPAPRKSQPVEQPKPVVQKVQRQPEPAKTNPPKAEPINLPKRRMLEDEEPLITNRDAGKLTPTTDQTKITPTDQVYEGRQLSQDIAGTRVSDRAPTSAGAQSDYTEDAPPTDVGPVGTQQPYTIEGDAAKRSILNQKNPQYPPGLQREAVVRIRFTVLPDGRVGQMIPVQKGDARLDEITIKALRQWRFNPLPPSAEQKNVTGIITFRYELQ